MPRNLTGQGLASAEMTRAEFGESDTNFGYFENYVSQARVRTVNVRADLISFAGSSMIWGNNTFGIWGSYSWADIPNTSFVLGHPVLGILGNIEMGTQQSEPARFFESRMWVDFDELFVGSDNFNMGSTSVSGFGTGSVVFGDVFSVSFLTGSGLGVGSSVGSVISL